MSTMRNTVSLITSLAIIAVALSGCASNETLQQEGSSTVLPLAEVWAEDFGAITGTAVNVAGGGSGHGASGLCDGTLDLGDMSRAMKDSEKETCRGNGIEPVEWRVAFDGLSVVVSKDNSFVKELTIEQLAHIFRKDAPATNWQEVDETFPDAEISVCMPDNESGTYEYFNEEVLDKGEPRTDAQQSADDNVLVSCIAGDDNAIGYFGFAYVKANQGSIKTVAIQNEDGQMVQPSLDTIRDGSYNPLGRPLYIYTAEDMSPAVHDYIYYVLTDGQAHVETVGYVKLSSTVQHDMLVQLGEA